MKVLIDHHLPFALAHGGAQTQIEETMRALANLGIDVEPLRWWDDRQTSDVVHFFTRPPSHYARFVKAGGRKLVISELLTGQASWKIWRRLPHIILRYANRSLGRKFDQRLQLDSYQRADAIITLTPWEQQLITQLYDAPSERVHVVPNGVQPEFFPSFEVSKSQREKWLVCTATITERKRVVELAEAATYADVPIWIIGRPYFESDSYYQRFLSVVEKSRGLVRYEGAVNDRIRMAEIYKTARGFVLLSSMESLSLSALEATASRCPLFLSDLPWARCTFGQAATYCRIGKLQQTADSLKNFYRNAHLMPVAPSPMRWNDVGVQIKRIYEKL